MGIKAMNFESLDNAIESMACDNDNLYLFSDFLAFIASKIHENAVSHGFYGDNGQYHRDYGLASALLHSEVSEYFEAKRRTANSNGVYHLRFIGCCPEKPDYAPLTHEQANKIADAIDSSCDGQSITQVVQYGEHDCYYIVYSIHKAHEELIDVLIRCLDTLCYDLTHGYKKTDYMDITTMLLAKHFENVTRPYRHNKNC